MFRTIRMGERIAVWDKEGRMETIDGPRRVFLIGKVVRPLERFAAGNGEYLSVTFADGRKENLRGPKDMWFDPVAHRLISVEKASAIDANEAIVVYKRLGEEVERRVLRGPHLYVPDADEWLHEFSWHGADPHDHQKKIPGALKFTRLRVIPDQMYFDVSDVRTSDDALLTLRLMIFFELADIERMLDQTHDPIADFINAVTADVMEFAAGLSFEEFKERTASLNSLDTYPQLTQRGARIGYTIGKVVYRGYHANDTLQAMHDRAIESRTKLRLEAETEKQAQELADMRLSRERERATEQHEMEVEELRHRNAIEAEQHAEKMRQKETEARSELEAHRQRNEVEEEHQRAMDGQRISLLTAMQAMQVDVTRYLVAQYQNPDRLIRIEDGAKPQLHLHD